MLSRLLRDAVRTIDIAVYEVGPSYRWELIRAAKRGIRVRLVLDAHRSDGNAATARDLTAAGGVCRVAGGGSDRAHGKLIVCDGAVAVGTGNLIWRDAPYDRHLRFPPASTPVAGTREWWVVASGSRDLAGAAAEAFAAHWSSATPPPPGWSGVVDATAPRVGIPLPQVAPLSASVRSQSLRLVTGGRSVASVLQSMVSAARRRVLVTVPYVHPAAPQVRDLICLMKDVATGGVECGLLLGGVPAPRDARGLCDLPFPVRSMDPSRSTSGHAKGAVADGTVLVSSANWSAAGLGGNWEAALHIRHPAAASYYAAAWRRDWETALPIDV
jgi:phosphatidylserine/phosphatidylglycerophosphate/cardiolipin synthase-like enzyme